jgi:hypothetical protein
MQGGLAYVDGLNIIPGQVKGEWYKCLQPERRPQDDIFGFRSDIVIVGLSTASHAKPLVTDTPFLSGISFSPEGSFLSVVHFEGDCQAGGFTLGKPSFWVVRVPKRADLACFSADGRALAVAEDSDTVHLWEVFTGRQRASVASPIDAVQNVLLSSDGRHLACVGLYGAVWVMDALSPKVRLIYPRNHRAWHESEPTNPAPIIAFSPRGRYLAVALADRAIRIFDLRGGKELARLKGHAGLIRALAFSPDGKLLASGCQDGTVRLWDLVAAVPGRAGKSLAAWDDGLPEDAPAATALSAAEAERAWADLASDRADVAYQAIQALVLRPSQAVTTISGRLRPMLDPGLARVAKLVADLDDRSFEVRERASAELAHVARLIEPGLRRALRETRSAEVRRRLQMLVRALELPITSGPELQRLRAIEVLEHVGGERASAVLREVAKGAPGALETRTAKAAILRLASRPGG